MQQASLLQISVKISDPRVNRCKKHSLLDIIILSVLCVLCVADTYDEIEMFGKANLAFLKQFLSLQNGIPSHDTINRVFRSSIPVSLNAALQNGQIV
jgi:predicted transposase YbfD/YdcC